MRRQHRLAVVLVAWLAPAAWVAVALSAGPSDGTVVATPTASFGTARPSAWTDEGITVLRTYGDTPLRPGDLVVEVDGRAIAAVTAEGPSLWAGELAEGEQVVYRVLRPGEGLDRVIAIPVVLTGYPVVDALAVNLPAVVIAVGVLLAGTWVFWRRSSDPAAIALLCVGSAMVAGLAAYPFGLGVSDLAGGRGLWPHLVSELLVVAGLGMLVVLALTFPPGGRVWERLGGWRYAVAAAPALAYPLWLAFSLPGTEGPLRLQGLLTITAPALVLAALLAAAAQVTAYVRAGNRDDRIAIRLVLLGAVAGLVLRFLLGDLPQSQSGEPLVPWGLLTVLVAAIAVGCLVVAMLRWRLSDVDLAVRRSLVQLLVVAGVGAVFLTAVGAIRLAAETQTASMVAGGVVALALIPLTLALRRLVVRLVYGDREFPYRVVSQLRRLEPRAAPDAALADTLAVLRQSLHLSYAAVEMGSEQVSSGVPRGEPTSVVLEVAGRTVGTLLLEVEPDRLPFGPRDRRLLEDIGGQVGALVQSVTTTRELQLSRERLIAAREEERRRVRRDLHDGLGPSLATMVMKLEVARDLIDEDPEAAAELVGQLTEQTRSDIGEIRRLVDGLRPPSLDQFGLVAALRQQAERHNVAARARQDRMVWSVHADGEIEPLPAAVEVAAYRIAVEAVHNAFQHSAAPSCEVRLRRDADTLDLEIDDDGVGITDGVPRGVGLASMRERAEELGGRFDIGPGTRGGTRVHVALPLAATTEREQPWNH